MSEKLSKSKNDIKNKLASLNIMCPQGYYVKYGIYQDCKNDGKVYMLYGLDKKVHYTRATFEDMNDILT